MKQISVIVADDHLLFREGVSRVLGVYEDVKIVAQASGGRQAIELVKNFKPDILLLDINMPGLDGFAVCKEIKETCPETKIIVLTVSQDLEHQLSAIQEGASAYLTKNTGSDELIDTIRKVFHEGNQLDVSMLTRMSHNPIFTSSDDSGSDLHISGTGGVANLFASLSRREREILRLVADGRANKYIAHDLNISEHTVRNHISNIFQKLQVSDRTEAAVLAIRNGIIN